MGPRSHAKQKARNLADTFHNPAGTGRTPEEDAQHPPRVTGGGQRADGGDGTKALPTARDSKGRFLAGGPGMTPGTLHRKTVMVQERLAQGAAEASRVVFDIMRDRNAPDFARLGAAKQVLDAALAWQAREEEQGDPRDTMWLNYATPRELQQVLAIADRATERMVDEEQGTADEPIDIEAQPAEPSLDDLIGAPTAERVDEVVIPPKEQS